MNLVPMISISAVCGLVAAGAAWWLVSVFENVAHTLRVRRQAKLDAEQTTADESKDAKGAKA